MQLIQFYIWVGGGGLLICLVTLHFWGGAIRLARDVAFQTHFVTMQHPSDIIPHFQHLYYYSPKKNEQGINTGFENIFHHINKCKFYKKKSILLTYTGKL
jgi:hypothetical protein